MRLLTKAAFARECGVSHTAISKAIERGALDEVETASGKKRIDADSYNAVTYKKSNVDQRQRSRKDEPDTDALMEYPYEKSAFSATAKAIAMNGVTSLTVPKEPDELDIEPDPVELQARKRRAETEMAEHKSIGQALRNAKTRGDLVAREVVYDQMIAYLDRLHANIERLADSFLSDVGGRIVDAGTVTPELRAEWKDEVMAQIDETKRTMVDELKRIAREQA